ncbi:hypothetical protein EDB19DRAFT_1830356 [Suillus lakei]|nr:hypothetical protein EDB19DRAFT_1830356 [Suillus lakei]
MISRDREPVNESIPLWGYPKRKFSARHACSNSSSQPAATTPNQQTPEWKVRAEENDKANTQDVDLPNCPTNAGLDANNLETDEGKRREGSLTNTQNQLVKLGSEGNFWKWPMRARGKDTTSVNLAPRPEVVEVYAVRGFQRYVALTSKRKAKSSAVMCSAPLAAVHKYGSSQPAPSSLVDPAQAGTLLQASSGQGGSSSLGTAAQGTPHLQAVGAHTLPSCFVTTYRTNHDSDSRSSIEGPCNRFLDKICFPCGHYYANS